TTAIRQQGMAVEDKEQHEEIRKEHYSGAGRRRSEVVSASGSRASPAKSKVRQVRRNRRLDYAAGCRPQARRPDGPRHCGSAAWAGQVEEGAGDRQRREAARGG